ncbi:hypothetical protein EIP91_004777 [Steccherinum ochraceum]|uniref:F-box domain-containing protein n=1 Tax=Steccherinum ochraceum TaxID=92696 RepID=A0A4R0RJD9_9APHY|nr:hypothetical protein EIP91_004777 [Steccherinum ochraceum]
MSLVLDSHTVFASLDHRAGSWLEEEEARAVAHVYRVRRRINAVVPAIARLPPEVLLEIFSWARLADDSPSGTRWIAVSHVCQHWRNQAICKPSLWTDLAPWSDAFLSLNVARSANLPLTFRWTDAKARYQPLLNYSSRCVSIEVILGEQRSMERFIRHFRDVAEPWSQLESIIVELDRGKCEIDSPYFPEFLYTADQLPGFPRLQYLSLTNVFPTSWSTISLHGNSLRTLYLSSQAASDVTSLPLASFWDMLSALPMLERLFLFDVAFSDRLPEHATAFPNPTRTIHLSRLRMLNVDMDHACDIAHLLSPLQLPDTAVLALERWDEDAEESVLAVLPHDRSRLSGYVGSMGTIQLGHIGVPFVGVFVAVCTTAEDVPFSRFYAHCPSDSDSENLKAVATTVRKTLSHLPQVFQGLSTLELFLQSWKVLDISSSEWVEIFRTLSPCLKSLVLVGDPDDQTCTSQDIEHLTFFLGLFTDHTAGIKIRAEVHSFDALASSVPAPVPGPLHDPLLPHLASLRFVSFGEPVQAALQVAVLRYLAARKSAALPPMRDLDFNDEPWDVEFSLQ